MDQRELARRLDRMERVVGGHAYASCSDLNLVERVFVLLRRCEARPPDPADSPGMRVVRAAIAATDGAPVAPQYDRRFWAAIREALRVRGSEGRINALL